MNTGPMLSKERFAIDVFCDICGKDMNTMQVFGEGEEIKPEYCHACRRAVRIAEMKAAGTLPKVDA